MTASWHVEETDGLPVILDEAGRDVAFVRDGWINEANGTVAFTPEVVAAHAHLIAAAPELLAALQAAVYTGRLRPFANEDQAFWEAWLPRGDAAIAKALGQSR